MISAMTDRTAGGADAVNRFTVYKIFVKYRRPRAKMRQVNEVQSHRNSQFNHWDAATWPVAERSHQTLTFVLASVLTVSRTMHFSVWLSEFISTPYAGSQRLML
jgi:hypothetical protein